MPTPPNPPEPQPPTPSGLNDYKILKGDNFFKLHKKFHVTMQALKDANAGVDSSKLKIGQTIHIPAPTAAAAPSGPGTTTETAPGQETYEVKSGDTLAKVARHFGVTVKALKAANNLPSNNIRVGQQ